jgi:outer membrane protein assembly factor BamB
LGILFLLLVGAVLPLFSAEVSTKWNRFYNEQKLTGGELGYTAHTRIDSAGNSITVWTGNNRRDGVDIIITKQQGKTGKQIWEKRHGSSEQRNDTVQAFILDARGDIIISGGWAHPIGATLGQADMFTAKFSGLTGELVWQRRFHLDAVRLHHAAALHLDAQGNICCFGLVPRSAGIMFTRVLLKYSPAGDELYQRHYDGDIQVPSSDFIDSVVDGGTFLTVANGGFISRFDLTTGDLIWTRFRHCAAFTADEAGHLLAVFQEQITGGNRFTVARLSQADGSDVWTRALADNVYVYDIELDKAGGFAVCGSLSGTQGSQAVVDHFSLGEGRPHSWQHLYRPNANAAYALNQRLKVDAQGHWLLAGTSVGADEFADVHVLKLTPAGKVVFSRQFSQIGKSDDNFLDLVTGPSSEIAVTGYSFPVTPPESYLLVRLSSQGAPLWRHSWGGGAGMSIDAGGEVAIDSLGDVVTTGTTAPSLASDAKDVVTVKFDGRDGRQIWVAKYDGPGRREDRPTAMVIDRRNDVFVCVTAPTESDPAPQIADVVVLKYEGSSGKLLWSRRLMLRDGGHGRLAVLPSGDLIVSAYEWLTMSGQSRLFRLNGTSGVVQWRTGRIVSEQFEDLKVAKNGDIFITHNYWKPANYWSPGKSTARITAIEESDGSAKWSRDLIETTDLSTWGYWLGIGPEDVVINLGIVEKPDKKHDLLLTAYRISDAQLLWQRRHATPHSGATLQHLRLAVSKEGEIAVTGKCAVSQQSALFAAKYDVTDGDALWTESDGLTTKAGFGMALALSPQGDLIQAKLDYSPAQRLSIRMLSGMDGAQQQSLDLGEGRNLGYYFEGNNLLAVGPGGSVAAAFTSIAAENTDTDIGVKLMEPKVPALLALEQPECEVIPLADGKDFGSVTVGSSLALTFRIRNVGGSELAITGSSPGQVRIEGSDAFTVTTQPGVPLLMPGQETQCSIEFKPVSGGLHNATLFIEADGNAHAFPLKGTGVSPEALTFASSVWRADHDASHVDIQVRREAAGTEASVTLAFTDGVNQAFPPFVGAQAGTDYLIPAVGSETLTFSSSETVKTLRVTLKPVSVTTPANRRFQIALVNPQNATLGALTSTTVEILAKDTTLPKLTLKTPVAVQTSRRPVLVTGTVDDVGGLKLVEVILNAGCPISAAVSPGVRAGSWTFTCPLSPPEGPNALSVRAVDLRGNVAVLSRSFSFKESISLLAGVSSADGGQVGIKCSPTSGGKLVQGGQEVIPGTQVQVTATSKVGYWFSHWTGLPESYDEEYNIATFIMPRSDLNAAQAIFVRSPLLSFGSTLEYRGLIIPDSISPQENQYMGAFSATVTTSTGVMTGKLHINGVVSSFTGMLRADGSLWFKNASRYARFLNLPSISLAGTWTADRFDLTGFALPGARVECPAFRAAFSKMQPVPSYQLEPAGNLGRFTVVFPIETLPESSPAYPGGLGYSTFTLSPTGLVNLTGTLADDTKITWAGPVTEVARIEPYCSFKIPKTAPNNSLGSFLGTLQLSDLSVFGTSLRWFRPPLIRTAASTPLLYEQGWPTGMLLGADGGMFRPGKTIQSALGFTDGSDAQLSFQQGGLVTNVNHTIRIEGNKILLFSGNVREFSLALDPIRGLILGDFSPDPARLTQRAKYQGVILQNASGGAGARGFFINTVDQGLNPQSGLFQLIER